jgi:hypothetical protein
MKCIKSIKTLKNTEIGEISRIDDVEAESKVKTGYWSYISKSEWKLSRGMKVVEKTTEEVTAQSTEQVDKKPYKKGSKPEKKSK